MIVIRLKDNKKYWTNSYSEKDGFLIFDTQTKTGSIRQLMVNKTEVVEISGEKADFSYKEKETDNESK